MCTPLMAQRCLLHHAALATGFCLFPGLTCCPYCLGARTGGMKKADCAWHEKIIAEMSLMCQGVWYAPARPPTEGARLVIAAAQNHHIRAQRGRWCGAKYKKRKKKDLFLWHQKLLCAGMWTTPQSERHPTQTCACFCTAQLQKKSSHSASHITSIWANCVLQWTLEVKKNKVKIVQLDYFCIEAKLCINRKLVLEIHFFFCNRSSSFSSSVVISHYRKTARK